MRISFNLVNVGAGNNGGTLTIYNSANILHNLGHDVKIVDNGKDKHTWTKLKCERVLINNMKKFPPSDVVIATGFKSVKPTINIPKNLVSLKTHWIRAFETWVYDEKTIINNVLNKQTYKLVNSICLRNKLQNLGFDSHLVRPGYDLNLFYPDENLKQEKNKIVLGALYREGIHGIRKRTKWIFDVVSEIKQEYNVELWLFGSEPQPKSNLVDKYLRQPNNNEKLSFYNNVDIWLAPTESEGLHMPPAEAMLCKTPVIGTTAELAGTQDYLFHNYTGLKSGNDINTFYNDIKYLLKNNLHRQTMAKNARDQVYSLGDRKYNMTKMVELFKYLLG